MSTLAFKLEREVVIRARRATVFRYFTDPERFARWWGAGSRIEPNQGGAVVIRYPNGVVARGEVLALDPPRSIVFSYGYEDPAKRIPPGGSRVAIALEETAEGTRLCLTHELPDAASRDHHAAGWPYQLAVFANVACDEEHADAVSRVDALFAAWTEVDAAARRRRLEAAVAPDVQFRDRFGCVAGIDELDAHLAAVQLHMRGVRLARDGALKHCQATAVARWKATTPDGQPAGAGLNVYDFAPDGRITRVVGLWD